MDYREYITDEVIVSVEKRPPTPLGKLADKLKQKHEKSAVNQSTKYAVSQAAQALAKHGRTQK